MALLTGIISQSVHSQQGTNEANKVVNKVFDYGSIKGNNKIQINYTFSLKACLQNEGVFNKLRKPNKTCLKKISNN